MLMSSEDLKLEMRFSGIRPTSTNEMYRPAYTAKSHRSYLRKSSELVAFQSSCQENVKQYHEDIQEFVEKCKVKYPKYLGFSLKIVIGLPMDCMFYKKVTDDLRPIDTSNLIKSIEDIVSSAVGIDDKYNMKVSAEKILSSNKKDWEFFVVLIPLCYLDELDLTEKDLENYANDVRNSRKKKL